MTTKVYLFLADGFETIEALAVVDILRRGGIEVKTVSIMGRELVESAQKVTVKADELFENVDLNECRFVASSWRFTWCKLSKRARRIAQSHFKTQRRRKEIGCYLRCSNGVWLAQPIE